MEGTLRSGASRAWQLLTYRHFLWPPPGPQPQLVASSRADRLNAYVSFLDGMGLLMVWKEGGGLARLEQRDLQLA